MNNGNQKIMILGAGIFQVPLILKAKEMGLFTIVCSYKGNYPGFAYADKIYYEDIRDFDSILKIAGKESIDGICITGADVGVPTLGKVSDELGLYGISYSCAVNSTSKLKMKEIFKKNNIKTANYKVVKSIKESNLVFKELNKPIIFKPIDSSGSKGVVKINNESDIEHAFEYAMKETKEDHFLMEEFIKGEEFGAQAYVYNNKINFIMPHGDIMHNIETCSPIIHYVPKNFSISILKDIKAQLLKCIKYLGIDNSAINADFIIRDNKIFVIEIGARSGGNCLTELTSIYYGFDYYKQIISAAIGKKPKFEFKRRQPAASINIMSDKNGNIISIKNNNKANDNILDISLDYKVGDPVRIFKVGPDRIGQIIVKEKSAKRALKLLKKVSDNIKIEV